MDGDIVECDRCGISVHEGKFNLYSQSRCHTYNYMKTKQLTLLHEESRKRERERERGGLLKGFISTLNKTKTACT